MFLAITWLNDPGDLTPMWINTPGDSHVRSATRFARSWRGYGCAGLIDAVGAMGSETVRTQSSNTVVWDGPSIERCAMCPPGTAPCQ